MTNKGMLEELLDGKNIHPGTMVTVGEYSITRQHQRVESSITEYPPGTVYNFKFCGCMATKDNMPKETRLVIDEDALRDHYIELLDKEDLDDFDEEFVYAVQFRQALNEVPVIEGIQCPECHALGMFNDPNGYRDVEASTEMMWKCDECDELWETKEGAQACCARYV